jgi:hypothetical protein
MKARVVRRSLIAGAGAALILAAAGVAHRAIGKPDVPPGPIDITIKASPLAQFGGREPDSAKVGRLLFESGLELTSDYDGFGGLSGLAVSADGRQLTALTDAGQWLSALIQERDGRMTGLSDARMAPILGANGRPLAETGRQDVESLALADGVAYVGIERVNEVLRFDATRDLLTARGQAIPVPGGVKAIRRSKGLEALGVARAGPLAGSLIAIAERSGPSEDLHSGFILTGPARGAFQVVRQDRFDITDLAFLPDGDMLILERRFEFSSGIAMRIRRIAMATIKPGATLDGPLLISADWGQTIDNMEGLAIHQGADGALRLTLVSDDNFSLFQRTYLLRFRLVED